MLLRRSWKPAEIGSFQYASVFSEGRATVKVGERFQVIDATGRVQFNSEFGWIGPYRNNRALLRVGGLYGFVDETGKIVIPAQYDAAESFFSGIAVVRRENKVNFIGTNGETVFDLPEIENAGSFKGGLGWVMQGGQYGYVRRDGSFLTAVPVPFDRGLLVHSENDHLPADQDAICGPDGTHARRRVVLNSVSRHALSLHCPTVG